MKPDNIIARLERADKKLRDRRTRELIKRRSKEIAYRCVKCFDTEINFMGGPCPWCWPGKMTCDHSERDEPVNYCNIRTNGDKHIPCAQCSEVCLYDPADCEHVFAVQVCACGKQFIGALGKRYGCDEMVSEGE